MSERAQKFAALPPPARGRHAAGAASERGRRDERIADRIADRPAGRMKGHTRGTENETGRTAPGGPARTLAAVGTAALTGSSCGRAYQDHGVSERICG